MRDVVLCAPMLPRNGGHERGYNAPKWRLQNVIISDSGWIFVDFGLPRRSQNDFKIAWKSSLESKETQKGHD